jgi:hypothetical protein
MYVVIYRGKRGSDAVTVDGRYGAICRLDEDRTLTAESKPIHLDGRGRKHGCRPRIYRVSPLMKDAQTTFSG